MGTERRCDLTELWESQCAHCRGIPDLPDDTTHHVQTNQLADVFDYHHERRLVARFDGVCALCGNDFEVGAIIWQLIPTNPATHTVRYACIDCPP